MSSSEDSTQADTLPNDGTKMQPLRAKRGVPEGIWKQCGGCQASIFAKTLLEQLNVCPECGYHEKVSAKERIRQVLDEGTFEEWDAELMPADPLEFADKKAYVGQTGAGLFLLQSISVRLLIGEFERIGRHQLGIPLFKCPLV